MSNLAIVFAAYCAGAFVTYVDARLWLYWDASSEGKKCLFALMLALLWPVVAALSLSLYVRSLFK